MQGRRISSRKKNFATRGRRAGPQPRRWVVTPLDKARHTYWLHVAVTSPSARPCPRRGTSGPGGISWHKACLGGCTTNNMVRRLGEERGANAWTSLTSRVTCLVRWYCDVVLRNIYTMISLRYLDLDLDLGCHTHYKYVLGVLSETLSIFGATVNLPTTGTKRLGVQWGWK